MSTIQALTSVTGATAPAVTVTTTVATTSTTTIVVASSAPSGVVGYLKISPQVNSGASYGLSDDATHLTDNYYKPAQRETFIVSADGLFYSNTNSAYYYFNPGSNTYSYFYWSTDKTKGLKIFTSSKQSDGTYKLAATYNSKNLEWCVKTAASRDGNSGTGMHIWAYYPGTDMGSTCVDIDLYIEPV